MDPIEQLAAWLDKPVYEEGVLLYQKFIGEDFLLTMLKMGKDEYNREKLEKALSARHEQLLTEQAQKKAAYPDRLVTALQSGGLLQDERMLTKEKMRGLYNGGVSESPELKELAFRILAINDELDTIYGRRDFFEQHGFLPDEATAVLPESDPQAAQITRRNNLRSYVSKDKRELETTFDPIRRAKLEKRLTRNLTELEQLDLTLKAIL